MIVVALKFKCAIREIGIYKWEQMVTFPARITKSRTKRRKTRIFREAKGKYKHGW